MSDVTAIDILIEPDQHALDRAGAENARLRAEYPAGFALDDLHRPHVTLLQRYVETGRLDELFTAVGDIFTSASLDNLTFRATGLRHMPVAAIPGHGLAAIVAQPAPDVIELQSALIDAVAPFTVAAGSAAAFVTTAAEPEINEDTLAYVARYVPDHSGANFVAHMTAGLAPLAYLEQVEQHPYDCFSFRPGGFAVFRLGNNGTAQMALKTWHP